MTDAKDRFARVRAALHDYKLASVHANTVLARRELNKVCDPATVDELLLAADNGVLAEHTLVSERSSRKRAQSERDVAVAWIRVVGEELVLAGYPAGDRDVILAGIRALRAERDALLAKLEAKP